MSRRAAIPNAPSRRRPLARAVALAALTLTCASLAAQPAVPEAAKGRAIGRGFASWYGPGFQGRATASGEKFDMHGFTAAHKTLPFGARVLVYSPRTGRQVVVRINDRGPYAGNYVIDLSQAAASALGLKRHGRDAVVLREAAASDRAGEAVTSAGK